MPNGLFRSRSQIFDDSLVYRWLLCAQHFDLIARLLSDEDVSIWSTKQKSRSRKPLAYMSILKPAEPEAEVRWSLITRGKLIARTLS